MPHQPHFSGVLPCVTTPLSTVTFEPTVARYSSVTPKPASPVRPTATLYVLPETITFTFGDENSESFRETITTAVQKTIQFWLEQGLVEKPDPLKVFVYEDRDQLVTVSAKEFTIAFGTKHTEADMKQLWTDDTTGMSGPRIFFIYASDKRWRERSSFFREWVVGHELTHVLQFQLMRPKARLTEPVWLQEGFANELASRIFFDVIDSTRFASMKTDAQRVPANITLENSTTKEGLPHFLSLSRIAIYYLIAIAPNDLKSVADYYSAQRTMSWQTAFKQTFQLSYDEFLVQFEQFRVLNFSPWPTPLP